jgi:hypothetical protein
VAVGIGWNQSNKLLLASAGAIREHNWCLNAVCMVVLVYQYFDLFWLKNLGLV